MSSVFRYDRVLICPGGADLERTLTEAAQAANKGCRVRTLTWTSEETRSLLDAVANAPEGFRQWNAPGLSQLRNSGTDTRSAIAVAWWIDPLMRPHYRVVGERILCASGGSVNLICPYRKRPPLWLVHPDHVYFREAEAAASWVACPCGMTGSPESLGWMGLSCAACHDRTEEGVLPRAVGDPARTVLVGISGWAGQVHFTPDGRTVIVGSRSGGQIVGWDLGTAVMRELRPFRGDISTLALVPGGASLAYGSVGQISQIAVADGRVQNTLRVGGPSDRLLDLTFSPDGSLLAIAPYGRVEIWDAASGTQQVVVMEGLTAHRSDRLLAFSPDGTTLAIGHGFRGGVHLWDVATRRGRNLAIPGIDYASNSVAFSPDGRTLGVIGSPPGRVYLVDVSSGRLLAQPDIQGGNGLAFSPDGRLLAVAGHDRSLRLFSVPEGQTRGVYYWHQQNLNAVVFSPDGQWLASTADCGNTKLWPVAALLAGEVRLAL